MTEQHEHEHERAARRERVEHGLLPIVRIADQPTRWTFGERLAHYRCPGTSVAVMHEGRIIADGGYEECLNHPEVRRSYWQIDTAGEGGAHA